VRCLRARRGCKDPYKMGKCVRFDVKKLLFSKNSSEAQVFEPL
jgi:hypothetical protein